MTRLTTRFAATSARPRFLFNMVFGTPVATENAGVDQQLEAAAPAIIQPLLVFKSTEEELVAKFKSLEYTSFKAWSTQGNFNVDGDEASGDTTEDRLLHVAEVMEAQNVESAQQEEDFREVAEAKTTLPLASEDIQHQDLPSQALGLAIAPSSLAANRAAAQNSLNAFKTTVHTFLTANRKAAYGSPMRSRLTVPWRSSALITSSGTRSSLVRCCGLALTSTSTLRRLGCLVASSGGFVALRWIWSQCIRVPLSTRFLRLEDTLGGGG
jgi:hypothetical protein